MNLTPESGQSKACVFAGKDKAVLLTKTKELYVLSISSKSKKKLNF